MTGAMTGDRLHRSLDALWRMESPRLVARIARMTGDIDTAEELAPLALSDRELDFACVSALEARLALIRSGGASAIVDMDLRSLGPLVKVLGGGAGEWASEGWHERPDFWKEIA